MKYHIDNPYILLQSFLLYETYQKYYVPILMSVKDGYQYLCIDLSPENYGKIYYGVEPEFEDSAEFVCDSFNHLLEMLSSNKKNDILTNFK